MWVCSYPFFSSGKKGCSCEGFSACPAGTSALVQLLWCHQRIILPGKLVRTSQWARTDGEAAKACGGPEFMFFPSQHCSCLFVFFRCEVGTSHWTQCNENPVKFARFPVTGLIEGRSYIFRVRAVNKAGVSLPSRVSEPVAALDPADRARLRSKMCFLQFAWEV